MENIIAFLNPETLLPIGMNVLKALVVLIVGLWIAKKVKQLIIKLGQKSPQLDDTLFKFLGSIARYVIMAFVFIAVFNVAYEDDVQKAREVIQKVLADHPHVKSDPAPFIEVESLSERSVEILVRPFTDGAHYFDVTYSVPEQIKAALGAAGMSTPYPQTRIIMSKD